MKIQLISENYQNLYSYKDVIDLTDLSNPISFNNYDVNILDFSNEKMWNNYFNTGERITNDLKNIKTMIKNTESLVIIVFPQNIKVGPVKSEAKNHLQDIHYKISQIINVQSSYTPFYENSNVNLLDEYCKATFAFESDDFETLLYTKTNKAVAIKKNNIIITSVKIIDNNNPSILEKFLHAVNCYENVEEIPEWVYKYEFFNDRDLNNSINNSKEIIKTEKEKINNYQEQLNNNLDYKKSLYCNGDELVQQVFKILEIIFNISLADFKDLKNEDFLFRYNDMTFIGEIKGVTSNVKSEHISQLIVHVSQYNDKLQDEGKEEKIVPLLIMNYERNKEISERNEIHQNQINLAKKMDIIIIDTVTLLHLFSDVLEEKITKEDAIQKITDSKGILKY